MNSAVLGMALAVVAGFFVVRSTTDTYSVYYNLVGLIVVIGGSLASAAISNGFPELVRLFSNAFKAFKAQRYSSESVVKNLITISNDHHKNGGYEIPENSHPFIADGIYLLQNEVEEEKIGEILATAIRERENMLMMDVQSFGNLSKYPPAFGMIGTVVGLVALLFGLGEESAQSRIGPNMSVALVTTLYGLLLSNLILQPITDSLTRSVESETQQRRIIVHGIMMLRSEQDPIIIQETLNAYLKPSSRLRQDSFSEDSSNTIREAA